MGRPESSLTAHRSRDVHARWVVRPRRRARDFGCGGLSTVTTAVVATLPALTTNTLSKAVLAAGVGKLRYALAVWPGLALILAGAWGGFAITRLA